MQLLILIWIILYNINALHMKVVPEPLNNHVVNVSTEANTNRLDLSLRIVETNMKLRDVIMAYKQMDKNKPYPYKYVDNKNHDFDHDSEVNHQNKQFLEEQHNYRRSGRHKRSTEEQGFLDDPNNVAMFIVFPAMVFIYGGCAVIYCCYKCRNYVNENRIFVKIKDRIKNRGKNTTTTNTVENPEDMEITDATTEELVQTERPKTCKPVAKAIEQEEHIPVLHDHPIEAKSNKEAQLSFVDVEYEEEIHSDKLTPLSDNSHEEAELPPMSDSQVFTDTSPQSCPSTCTISTRVSTVSEHISPIYKSVSVQSEDGQIMYSAFPNPCLVDMGCQTEELNKTSLSPATTVSVRSRINKLIKRKKPNAKQKTTKLGQIHYVENYASLNPYRDQVEADGVFLSRGKNRKMGDRHDECGINTSDSRTKKRVKSSTSSRHVSFH